MSDTCPTCGLILWTNTEQFEEGKHCEDSPQLPMNESDGEACYRRGFERLSEHLASTKAQLDTSRLLLVKSRDALDLAISALAPPAAGFGADEGDDRLG